MLLPKSQNTILGHFVSSQGIEHLPEKLESVKVISPYRNPKETKQFLEQTGFYRKFLSLLI